MNIVGYLNSFFNLFFPESCITCGQNLVSQENLFCIECLYDMPKTDFHNVKDNPVSNLFIGLTQIERASAFFFFYKGSKFQNTIHKLKYSGVRDVGVVLGKQYGIDLANSLFSQVDVIVPVPLHPKRFKTRGYNQSEAIAEGLSEILNVKYDFTSIIRAVYTETQTRKSLDERRDNVDSIFEVKNYKSLIGKHVLLVDDVITTGSTLVSLSELILKIPGTKVSIVALAIASVN